MPTPPPLLKVFYVSRCAPSVTPTTVRRIVGTSQMRNRRAGITGVLACTGGHFAQVLEGEPAAVDELMQAIREDPRHEAVQVLMRQADVTERDFSGWSMHLLDSPDLNDSVWRLLDGQAVPHPSLARETLARILAMARYEATGDLDPPVAPPGSSNA